MISYQEKYAKQVDLEEKLIMCEIEKGTSIDYFFSYANLLRELLPINNSYKFDEVWKNYRVYIKLCDLYRNHPGIFEVDCKNMEYLSYLQQGGAIVSLHYGNYRAALYSIGRLIRNLNTDQPFRVLVDAESYKNEPRTCVEEIENCKYLIAESPTIARDILELFRNNGILFVFLDGNAGSGVDKNAARFKFISSQIKIRSGFFRLLDRVKKPVLPIIALNSFEKPTMKLGEPIYNDYNDINIFSKQCYDFFISHIIEKPEFWRFWFRHHLQVENWCSSIEGRYNISNIKYISNNETLVIDESTGKVLKYNKCCEVL